MLQRLSVFLLVLWLALIGADRIDLLGGSGGIRLTPFLVLTPLVIFIEVLRLLRRGGLLRVPAPAAKYALAVTLLLCVTLTSVFFSYDPAVSAKRFGLLVFQVYATLCLALFIGQHPARDRILVRGAFAGIGVALLFNVAQMVAWFTVGPATGDGSQIDAFVFLQPWSYGPWVPRLSGQVIDMNRGGFLLTVYLFLLIRFAPRSGWRTFFALTAVISILATLSRSATLGLLVMTALLLLQSRRLQISRGLVMTGTVAVGLLAALSVSFPSAMSSSAGAIVPPLTARFFGDGSSSIHFELLRHGFEVGSASVKNALLGVGFGNAYAVLEEFFPGNEYGNFHSLYLTFLAETGVISLCLGLLLLLYPLVRSSTYRPLIAGLMAFSVFYQTNLEPMFWLVLAAAWLEMGPRIHQEAPVHAEAVRI